MSAAILARILHLAASRPEPEDVLVRPAPSEAERQVWRVVNALFAYDRSRNLYVARTGGEVTDIGMRLLVEKLAQRGSRAR